MKTVPTTQEQDLERRHQEGYERKPVEPGELIEEEDGLEAEEPEWVEPPPAVQTRPSPRLRA